MKRQMNRLFTTGSWELCQIFITKFWIARNRSKGRIAMKLIVIAGALMFVLAPASNAADGLKLLAQVSHLQTQDIDEPPPPPPPPPPKRSSKKAF
jgi:hypothetical protein